MFALTAVGSGQQVGVVDTIHPARQISHVEFDDAGYAALVNRIQGHGAIDQALAHVVDVDGDHGVPVAIAGPVACAPVCVRTAKEIGGEGNLNGCSRPPTSTPPKKMGG